VIEVQALARHFGGVEAVSDLSFIARDGSITGLLGSNGAGKTTTLRMICGVLRPQGGAVRVDGISPYPDRRSVQRKVGALLDHMGLYPRLTARENLTYFGQLHGIAPERLKQRVDELISLLGLQPVAGRRTAGFSQGERMKTALGRSMIHSPNNLLLDEPTNGLDVPTVRSLRLFLQRVRDAGACVVFSSHVHEEVRALCDNVVIISKGRLIAEGSPGELCRQSSCASLEDAFVKLTGVAEIPAC
jgi:sodium transport system ATP-binding protein